MNESAELPTYQPTSVYCALISCGAFYPSFRTIDVIFWDELFRDALQTKEQGLQIELHPIQIDRFMTKMAAGGLGKVKKENVKKVYSITPHGIVTLLAVLVPQDRVIPLDETLLIQYFIDTYRDLLRQMITATEDDELIGKFESLTVPGSVLQYQSALQERVIKDSMQRIKESENLLRYIESKRQEGKSISDIQEGLPESFSYRMSYRKSFKEWLSYLPENVRQVQFDFGFKLRKEAFYEKRLLVQRHTQEMMQDLSGTKPEKA